MIKTVKDYVSSLRDGRVAYCLGERVHDVTSHPILTNLVQTGAVEYYLADEPLHRSLFVEKDENGEEENNCEE